ncbi:dihydroxyacetone kinase [Alicyclobacillus contaminans]|uniref:DAK2 domain-containing protein n=1 Tax=Alicyclobacillus contaminans TaxID=392016 RepID=UPI00040BF120|nr:DAK2 domain-containing protein [Alicyclobacillus contaminans]GMA49103.1 dihydroxyacetone kinase [Alicyclobacillus contaminans]
MTTQYVSGAAFVALLRAGHARLKEMRDSVNALNVFPVPDGDTGTNMEMTLASGVAALPDSMEASLSEVTQALATGLMMGARGNSGVILSQLFRGFAKAGRTRDALDVVTFARALYEGVQIAYRAVAKPVEGTILTVAREAAAAGLREARQGHDFAAWMDHVLDAAARALQRTPELLPVLKQADVVDSGGQGLVFIFEGFARWFRGGLAGGPISSAEDQPMPGQSQQAMAPALDGEFGYCTEVLVRVPAAETDRIEAALRQQLTVYGDSLLVVAAEDLVKVHVHTLHPGRVLEDALTYGPLVKIKIDNMTEQHAEWTMHHAARPPRPASPSKELAVVVVAAGDGMRDIFRSLGADVVISGGQTMNPSTEEIVIACQSTGAASVIVLPNNKNIVMAARQAVEILDDCIHVVPTATIPEGIAAMMAMQAGIPVETLVQRMRERSASVHSGLVVRAVRDSVFQGMEIRENQFLGFDNQRLIYVGNARSEAVRAVVEAMAAEDAELLTVFYGNDVSEDELRTLVDVITSETSLEVELKYGGQPIYDYIFSLE